MTSALPLDAETTPEFTSSTSPTNDHHIEGQSDIDLNLDIDLVANDLNPPEITSHHVNPPDITDATPPLKASTTLQWLDPQDIRIGEMPNRTSEAYSDEAFESLCLSMTVQGGNTQLIQVRLLTPAEKSQTPNATYQLVSGERRLRAARANGQLVQTMVFEGPMSSDAQLIALTENLSRVDLSPYEWGRQLVHLTLQKPGYSLSRLAQLSGRDKSVVSRAIELATLPTAIVEAFTSVRDLRYADSKPLKAAFKKSSDNVLVEADLIKEERANFKGPEVVKRLVAAANGDVARCNTAESIAIKFEEKVIGELTNTKTGGSQIIVNLQLSNRQRLALAAQIENFVSRRVLRTLTPEPEKSHSKPRAKSRSIAPTQLSLPTAAVEVERIDA